MIVERISVEIEKDLKDRFKDLLDRRGHSMTYILSRLIKLWVTGKVPILTEEKKK